MFKCAFGQLNRTACKMCNKIVVKRSIFKLFC